MSPAMELEYNAFWAIKKLNFDLDKAGHVKKFQLNEMEEIRHESYENAKLYKERTKSYHDRNIQWKEFTKGHAINTVDLPLRFFISKILHFTKLLLLEFWWLKYYAQILERE
ncbi:hypothetical protein L3X38_003540 [Prunus dulcis]|uniref:Reverse transcriptase domain-containing protein n=1 Tax=Prunus dulcis TaxID=3755 RepID=A0AAD4ZMB4_PRUDU|nr:hypothetical protein L3X38_003540 [Prunus dulcis]